jgi:hypothetical protein
MRENNNKIITPLLIATILIPIISSGLFFTNLSDAKPSDLATIFYIVFSYLFPFLLIFNIFYSLKILIKHKKETKITYIILLLISIGFGVLFMPIFFN